MLSQTLVSAVAVIDRHKVLDVLFREVLGINVPKILLTRSKDERLDAAVSEMGNTLGFFGAGAALNKTLDVVARWVPATQTAAGQPWWHIGKSFALFGFLTSVIWGMPFLRNALTQQRLDKTMSASSGDPAGISFARLIQPESQNSAVFENSQKPQQSTQDYFKQFANILGVGASVAFGAVSMGLLLAKKGLPLDAIGKALHTYWTLPEGQFRNFSSLKNKIGPSWLKPFNLNDPSLWFWGLPAYGGWIHASRDNYELKEQLLKCGNFLAGFFVVPRLMERVLKDSPRHVQYLAGTAASLAMLSGTLLLNFKLTEKRLAQEKAAQTKPASEDNVIMRSSNIQSTRATAFQPVYTQALSLYAFKS